MLKCSKVFLFLFVLLCAILLSLQGCDISQEQTPANSYSLPPATEPPISTRLAISHAPKVGETADLTFTIKVNSFTEQTKERLAKSRAWVEFVWVNTQGSYSEAKYGLPVPLEQVLVSGNLNWAGDAFEAREIGLSSTVRLPREGIWIIYGYLSGENWNQPQESRMAIAVTKDTAAIMGTEEFRSGPLAYLGNFPYGQAGRGTLSELHPVIMELDISKAPRVGEEAILTCRISSLHDVSNFSTELRFFRRRKDNSILTITPASLLVNGVAEREFNLQANETVEFSATIKFPEEGDWWIYAEGISEEDRTNHTGGYADNLRMTITGEKSFFSWQERQIAKPVSFNWLPIILAIIALCVIGGVLFYILKMRKHRTSA